MIRPLRHRHRRMFIALGVFLPIVFAVGVVARKPVPDVDSLPDGLVAAPAGFTSTEWERADLFIKSPMRVRLLRGLKNHFAVRLSAPKDFVKPDLIVYWVAGHPTITETLPDNAQLLGVFNSSTPLELPAQSAAKNGTLILYSLADGEVIEASKPIEVPKP